MPVENQCDPATLLADGKCFLCLEGKQGLLVIVALLRQWMALVSPAVDTTPAGLLAAAAADKLIGLETKPLKQVQVQLLCDLVDLA